MGQQLGEAKVKLCIQDHNREKDGEYGGRMCRCAKSIVWMLQEANYQHAGEIEHLESENSITYHSQDYHEEPMGQNFRQYTNFSSVCEQKSLLAIGDGRITTAPIQDANTTIEPKDFFSGDDSLFASFDLDEAIQNLNRKRAPPSPLGGEPMNANSGDEPNMENTTANIASIQRDTATSSPPAAKRPQSHSAGRTVYNQKEGNRAILSPS
jgi:hypothetical protein